MPPTDSPFRRMRRLLDRPRAAVVLCLGLLAWYLSNLSGSYFVDEPVYVRTGQRVFAGEPYHNPTHIFAPLPKYLIGAGQALLGESEAAARFPMALLGAATCYLVYRLGTRLADREVGLLAAALLGTTYLFATFAVMAMLDMTLTAAYVGATLAAVAWAETDRRLPLALVGVAAAAAVTSKAQGFVYAVPLCAAVAGIAWRRYAPLEWARAMGFPVVSGLGALLIVYLPFLVTPHPPLGGMLRSLVDLLASSLPVLGEAVPKYELRRSLWELYTVPVLGNLAYVFTAAVVQNFAHLGDGHAIVVAGRVYQYPPWWSYLAWLVRKGGLVYPLALALLTVGGVRDRLRGADPGRALLLYATLFPLAGISLLTVKFPRYLLPLLPLLAVGGVLYGREAARALAARLRERGCAPRTARVAVAAVVLAVLLASPSPVVASATQPANVDPGFDEAADAVERYAESHPDEEVVVLAYHAGALNFYLEGEHPNLEVRWYTPSNVGHATERYRRLRDRMAAGEIDLVVTTRSNPRARGLPVYDYVRSESTELAAVPQSPRNGVSNVGRQLVVYRLNASASA